jgi:hypothetical protein
MMSLYFDGLVCQPFGKYLVRSDRRQQRVLSTDSTEILWRQGRISKLGPFSGPAVPTEEHHTHLFSYFTFKMMRGCGSATHKQRFSGR